MPIVPNPPEELIWREAMIEYSRNSCHVSLVVLHIYLSFVKRLGNYYLFSTTIVIGCF